MLGVFNFPVKHGIVMNCDNMEMSLQERINELFSENPQHKPADLARFLGISRAAVSDWLSGKTKTIAGHNAIGVAKYFHVNFEWVQSGKGKKHATILPEKINIDQHRTYIRGYVPLVSWVQAGEWCESIESYSHRDAEEWLPCPVAHGKRTYALRVVGDSMTAQYPCAKSYPEGTIIFIDPDKQITNGCRVVAKLPHSNDATFKEYREDGGKRYLKPLNPQYSMQEIDDDTQLCGVIIGQFLSE